MATGWTHIRVRDETLDWLRREALHISSLAIAGKVEQPLTDRHGGQQGCGVSVDAIIWRLIQQAVNHRKRKKKATALRRAQRAERAEGIPAPGPGPTSLHPVTGW